MNVVVEELYRVGDVVVTTAPSATVISGCLGDDEDGDGGVEMEVEVGITGHDGNGGFCWSELTREHATTFYFFLRSDQVHSLNDCAPLPLHTRSLKEKDLKKCIYMSNSTYNPKNDQN